MSRWDCLAHSRLTAIPYFAAIHVSCKIFQPQLVRARTIIKLRLIGFSNYISTQIKKTLTKAKVFFMGREMGFEPTHIGTTISLRDNIKRKNRYFSPFRNIIYHFINILWLHIGYMDFNKSPYMEDRKINKE